MAPPLLSLQDIHLTLGGAPLLDGAELAVAAGERICLVGRNGSGKSTLLKIAAGLLSSHDGRRFLQPGATIRYMHQEPDFGDAASVLAYVEGGLGPGDDPYRARALLEQVGLRGDEAPARLSGGEARRAALVRALAPEPDLLLLDEPTTGVDAATEESLLHVIRALVERGMPVLMTTHDLDRAPEWFDRLIVVDHRVLADGDPATVLAGGAYARIREHTHVHGHLRTDRSSVFGA
jgi:ATP-binding cassette subfamily F protein uup